MTPVTSRPGTPLGTPERRRQGRAWLNPAALPPNTTIAEDQEESEDTERGVRHYAH